MHQCGRLPFGLDEGLEDESGLEVLLWDQGRERNGYAGWKGVVERTGRKMLAG